MDKTYTQGIFFFFFQFTGSNVKETFLKVPETKTINKADNIKGVKTLSLSFKGPSIRKRSYGYEEVSTNS